MKLVKIRFTAWRDQPDEPRSPAFQQLLDDWTTRINLLSVAAARIEEQQAHADSEALQKALDRISAELQKIDDERTPLLTAEEAVADTAARAAREHKKIGTFGYQVLNDAGTHVGYIVDEAGHYLPPKAVYSYEVVDDDPPYPRGQRKERSGAKAIALNALSRASRVIFRGRDHSDRTPFFSSAGFKSAPSSPITCRRCFGEPLALAEHRAVPASLVGLPQP